jgi:hypothetical protein
VREGFLLGNSQRLIAKDDNLVFEKSPFDFVKGGVGNRLRKI